ncbi:GTP cyclohydrolase II [Methyloversatilis thermotolerans]|uniref:GTP cyclohydrolase II n=1 Tax=Methyloversatilis thermotolerans TaxID=1346290 RepID=UPI00037FFACD|nr:GTP cyclohydrolase II [Methyloversatilis thermotolerans]
MRQIQRAVSDLRRGWPVLLRGARDAALALALESATAEALTEARRLAGSHPRLVLTRHRMQALGHSIAHDGLALMAPVQGGLDLLHGWATLPDAQLPDTLVRVPAEPVELAGLRMLMQAHYLPALLSFPVAADREAALRLRVAQGDMLEVQWRSLQAFTGGAGGALTRVSEARIPLAGSPDSRFVLFREADGQREHVAILIGNPAAWRDAVPVRLHSACLTGDLFGSLRCDCGDQLRRAVAAIAAQGGGVLLYLAQEGRGIGLANKLRAYTLQDGGLDTVDADHAIGFGDDGRDFGMARDMLGQLGIQRICLLTNNPGKIEALEQGGLEVVARQSLFGELTEQNRRYLHAKAHRHGHDLHALLELSGADEDAVLRQSA